MTIETALADFQTRLGNRESVSIDDYEMEFDDSDKYDEFAKMAYAVLITVVAGSPNGHKFTQEKQNFNESEK